MNIQEVAKNYEDYQIKMRRYFHENPEVSGKEYNTSKVIKEELDKIGVPWVPCGLETGVLATIQGAKPGKTILLRGDMDALTVEEKTGAPYASKNQGIMHACGHDCHTSMLLTAAHILNDMKDELCGTVKFAFQPAEEIAQGAKSMIDNGALEGVDGCYGMHVWADVSAGKVGCLSGPMMASADMFKIIITGKGGHGAQPERCVDAAVVSAAVINNLQSIVSREFSPLEPVVVTVGKVEIGSRWNVIAETGVLEGTTRCFSNEIYAQLPKTIERIVTDTCKAYRAEGKLEYTPLLRPTVNNDEMASLVRNTAKELLGDDAIYNGAPTTGAEDFSEFNNRLPGAIAFLGIANEECGAVWPQHSNKFCVDESVLIKGAMLYAQIAMNFNSK